MGYQTLVEANIDEGEKVLQALQEDDVDVSVAFWAKLSIYDDWRLFVASPTFDREPLLDGYGRTALALDHKFKLSEPPVIILRTGNSLIRGVVSEVNARQERTPLRIQSKQLGDRYVEDSYVYMVHETVQ